MQTISRMSFKDVLAFQKGADKQGIGGKEGVESKQDAVVYSTSAVFSSQPFYENRWTFIMKKNIWVRAGILMQAGNKCQSSACMSV